VTTRTVLRAPTATPPWPAPAGCAYSFESAQAVMCARWTHVHATGRLATACQHVTSLQARRAFQLDATFTTKSWSQIQMQSTIHIYRFDSGWWPGAWSRQGPRFPTAAGRPGRRRPWWPRRQGRPWRRPLHWQLRYIHISLYSLCNDLL
jgi:hypothetical protein